MGLSQSFKVRFPDMGVLGNQYGVTVEIGGSEAYTDGKTIHLPALPSDS